MTDETTDDVKEPSAPPAPPAPPADDDRISRVESKLDALIDTVSKIVAGKDDDDESETTDTKDDPPEIPPQIDIREASERAIKPERGPKPMHFLFKRIGRS